MKAARFAHLFVATCLLLTIGCFRKDILTLEVEVPEMATAECSKIIQSALSRIEGVISAEPDFERRTMTVVYNGQKLNIKNVEYLIAGVGFDANGIPGKPEAKRGLPAECTTQP